jgi:ketosteroid isomerase-like protein
MSQQNVEVVREMLDALLRRDRDGFVACMAPDIEWDDREGWPGVRRTYYGRTGVRKWWDAFMGAAEILSAEIEEITEVASGIVLLCVFGTFQGELGEFNARGWYVFRVREGKVARARLFWTRKQALEAAGLV